MSAPFFKYGQKSSAAGYRQQNNPPSAQPVRPTNPAPVPSTDETQPGMRPAQQSPNHNRGGSAPAVPSENHRHPAPADSPASPETFLSKKIWKINGKDRVVDFSSRLSVAKVEDYANVHGCGGKGHAANSTVAVTICDYSKGKGSASVTTSFNVEVEQIDVLYQAAMDARLGKLAAPSGGGNVQKTLAVLFNDLSRWEASAMQQPVAVVPANELTTSGVTLSGAIKTGNPADISTAANVVVNELRRWQKNLKLLPMAATPLQELSAAKNALAAALNTNGMPYYDYSAEKNDPYKRDKNGIVPVSKIYIAYTPTRQDGSVSRYPWLIRVENFDAPLNTRQNGATSHDASKATNKKVASINLSADDFAYAMVAVKRFIRVWEIAAALPVVRRALGLLAQFKARKEAEQNDAA